MRLEPGRGALFAALALLVTSIPNQALLGQDNGAGDELPLKPARWARFTTSEGTWISLDVSADGQTIVFDLLGDLYTIPIGGGTATRLTHGIAHDVAPRFSPDGREIVFVSDRSGDNNVWIMAADGSDVRAISKGVGSDFRSPEWTPDGDYIVVSRIAPLQGLEKLWLYHVRGGTGINMTPGLAACACWGRRSGPTIGTCGTAGATARGPITRSFRNSRWACTIAKPARGR